MKRIKKMELGQGEAIHLWFSIKTPVSRVMKFCNRQKEEGKKCFILRTREKITEYGAIRKYVCLSTIT